MAPGEGDDVVTVWPGNFQRLIIAMGEHVGKFGPQFQEMPSPRQFQMTIRPVLRETFPIGSCQ